jgi:hypothetical protein
MWEVCLRANGTFDVPYTAIITLTVSAAGEPLAQPANAAANLSNSATRRIRRRGRSAARDRVDSRRAIRAPSREPGAGQPGHKPGRPRHVLPPRRRPHRLPTPREAARDRLAAAPSAAPWAAPHSARAGGPHAAQGAQPARACFAGTAIGAMPATRRAVQAAMPMPIMPACMKMEARPPMKRRPGLRLWPPPGYYYPHALRLSLLPLLRQACRSASASVRLGRPGFHGGGYRGATARRHHRRIFGFARNSRDSMVSRFLGPMPPKSNPTKLNPLQLDPDLLQAIPAGFPARPAHAGGRHRHHPFPHAHGDRHLGDARCGPRATGLEGKGMCGMR